MRERLRKGRRCMDTVQSDEYVVRVRGVRERQAGEQCTATAFRGPVGRGGGHQRPNAVDIDGCTSPEWTCFSKRRARSDTVSAPFAERHRESGVNGGALTGIVVSAQRSRRPVPVPRRRPAQSGGRRAETGRTPWEGKGCPPCRVPVSAVSFSTPREEEEALLDNLSAFDGGLSRETGVESP